MNKTLALSLCLFVCPAIASAQTITSIGTQAVRSGDDFATRAFQDPWDMSERTDLGWFVNSTDQPATGFAQPVAFNNGEFVGITTTANSYVEFLETGNPNAAKIGKIGYNYPIDASTYKYLAFRMSVAIGPAVQFIWNRTDIYDGTTTTGFNVTTTPGYRIYLVDLTNLPNLSGPTVWSGLIRYLRMNTSFANGDTVKLDWVRLVNVGTASSCRTITWTGATNVDLYVTDASGNSLGKIASNVSGNTASPGCTATGSGYAYYAGALAPGTYRVGVSAVGGTAPTSTTAAGTIWIVNDVPTLAFTSPDPEGSSDDFATTMLSNAWDMNSLSDLDLITNVSSPQITTVSLENAAGAPLGNLQVFKGTSVSAAASGTIVGDPYVDPLFTTKRGFNNRIDTNKYRILTVEFGIPNLARDIVNGSIARVVWRVAGQTGENVSDDIIVNHRLGANVLDKFTVDMADRTTLPLEPGSPGDWVNGNSANPGLDIFRFDPHEFSNPTDFYIRRIKLAALERASSSYTIRWTYADSQAGTASLYYNTVNSVSCASGTQIVAGIAASTGQASWGVESVANGTYYICASFSDTNGNSNETYAKWPVIVDHSFANAPRLALSRTDLNFGIVQRPNETFPLVATSAQTVRVTVIGSPSNVCWTVDPAVPAQTTYVVTLSGGGSQVCGNGSFTIAVNPNSTSFNVTGIGEATFKVREVSVGTTSNSPQYVHAVQQIYPLTNAPAGLVDTPASSTLVSGSIAVTGWATDDVDIASVGIYRDPVSGEGSAPVFIGSAVRVDDARPDVEAANPLTPYNYRAGWGYLLLTNFLPNQGDGPYTLRIFVTDVDGHTTLIGSPTIVGVNSSSIKPFGAIDTPAQGEVISASASYNNFGWVLARGATKASPFFNTGAVVNVVIDGVAVGAPSQWTSRSDLSGLFPVATYSGVDRALGVFSFDSSAYSNGVHTIAWGVTADNGQSDGIGSRYFTVTGSSSVRLSEPGLSSARLDVGSDLGRRVNEVGVIAGSGPQTVLSAPMRRVIVNASNAGTRSYDAYLVANGKLRQLPVGASFDSSRGILYWQPGVGFTGAYDFVVVRDGRERVPVRVVLQPDRVRTGVRRGFDVQFGDAPGLR